MLSDTFGEHACGVPARTRERTHVATGAALQPLPNLSMSAPWEPNANYMIK